MNYSDLDMICVLSDVGAVFNVPFHFWTEVSKVIFLQNYQSWPISTWSVQFFQMQGGIRFSGGQSMKQNSGFSVTFLSVDTWRVVP